MRLRRFEAATVAEALARVRDELGPDAVILHAREPELAPRAGGPAGRVEVTAAVDEDGAPAGGLAAGSTPGEAAALLRSRTTVDCAAPGAWTRATPVFDPAGPGTMEQMYQMLLELHEAATPAPRMTPGLQRLYRELCRRDLPAALARQILSNLPAPVRKGRRAAERVAVRAVLSAAFRVQGDVPSGTRRVVVLVGPTGVGKTTTIAKLAGQRRQAGGAPPVLVSLDTYRIGATAQMQIYAELLGVPLRVARTPDDLARDPFHVFLLRCAGNGIEGLFYGHVRIAGGDDEHDVRCPAVPVEISFRMVRGVMHPVVREIDHGAVIGGTVCAGRPGGVPEHLQALRLHRGGHLRDDLALEPGVLRQDDDDVLPGHPAVGGNRLLSAARKHRRENEERNADGHYSRHGVFSLCVYHDGYVYVIPP